MQVIPPIGISGIWNLNTPFDALLKKGVPYTLRAIRQLTDILSSGGDPETDYYIANKLTSNIYLADLAINVSILSLQDTSSNIIYVPSSFVKSYPNIGGVSYRVLALTANIGAIPDDLSLAYLLSKITDDIKETIGVNAIVKLAALSSPTLLSNADAAAVEAARQANIGSNHTDYTRYIQTQAQLTSALEKIRLLEQLIKELHAAGVTLPPVPNI